METEDVQFARVVPLSKHIAGIIHGFAPPFSEPPLYLVKIADLAERFLSSIERLLGSRMYVKSEHAVLDGIPPKFFGLLQILTNKRILVGMRRCPIPRGLPDIPSYLLRTINGVTATGFGLDKATAFQKALAELLERHCLFAPNKEMFVAGSWSELRGRGAVHPSRFGAFSSSQLKQRAWSKHMADEDSRFTWVRCKSFFGSKPCLIPANLIFMAQELFSGEIPLRKAQGSGVAAGISRESALYHALCESIERDAVMIHWLNRISPPQIELRGAKDPVLNELLRLYQVYKIDFSVFDITTNISVPTVLVLIREKNLHRPLVHVAARADIDIECAVTAALFEGLSVAASENADPKEVTAVHRGSYEIKTIRERHAFWSDHSLQGELSFLFANPQKKQISAYGRIGMPFAPKMQELKKTLRVLQLDIYEVDITSEVAREAGLFVIAAVIPELYPLYLDEHYRYLGIRRLFEVPQKTGVATDLRREEEMNKVPHPFL
jgi:ribosomal protein S12 methylthiotransferase accessory factor